VLIKKYGIKSVYYHPPFTLTNRMTLLVSEIAELIGAWKAVNQNTLVPALRRGNRIKTIQASLAVEQNTLSVEQVTAVLDGKSVLGTPKEIQEVHNAFAAYEAMEQLNPTELDDLLKAHAILMRGLIENAGHWRTGGAAIYQEDKVIHVAPPASQLPRLMSDLFDWLKNTDAHPLIASAAFHYEFEFIHPFSDGNGRMGRLWQTLILSQWQPLLAYLPVETVIKYRQADYYQRLGEADASSNCSTFIEFLLEAIQQSLQEAIDNQSVTNEKARVEMQVQTRVKTPEAILNLLKDNPSFSLAEVATHLGKATSTIERAVAKLQQEGRLTHEGAKKGGLWRAS
jgi:Fic family protein